MLVSTHSPQRVAVILAIFLSVSFNVCATAIERRATCCIGQCDDDDNGNQAPTLDGPTSDRSPGIGVEFETSGIIIESKDCDKPSTDTSKGAMVGNRQGDNWKLTADTTLNRAGALVAEYILDGTKIKLGTGKAAEAAAAVSNDIVILPLSFIDPVLLAEDVLQTTWNPSADMQDPHLDVEDSTCNPWTVTSPRKSGGAANSLWAVQVTAPLPLEAIQDLFSKAVKDEPSALIPAIQPSRGMVYVTKDFFQANPNGITSDSVKDDVLGFFSLVISYAKGAREEATDESPKNIISIMPRTDWTNLFKQVKSAVPGSLYEIVKILACYRYFEDGVE